MPRSDFPLTSGGLESPNPVVTGRETVAPHLGPDRLTSLLHTKGPRVNCLRSYAHPDLRELPVDRSSCSSAGPKHNYRYRNSSVNR